MSPERQSVWRDVKQRELIISHFSLPESKYIPDHKANSLINFRPRICVAFCQFYSKLISVAFVPLWTFHRVLLTNLNGGWKKRSRVFVDFFFFQAVRVQDPPHGLPAAAAGRLQLQEPRQGHPLERPGRRKRRKIHTERASEREKTGKNYHQKERGHLHFTKLFQMPPPHPEDCIILV